MDFLLLLLGLACIGGGWGHARIAEMGNDYREEKRRVGDLERLIVRDE